MKNESNGGAMGLGLSDQQKFDGKAQGNTADTKTGIPAKVKTEKAGKHTIK